MKFANLVSVPSLPTLPKLPKIDPSLLSLVTLGTLFLALTIIQNRQSKNGKTATARWAKSDEIAKARKIGKLLAKNPQLKSTTFYISEPVGSPTQLDKAKIFIPYTNRGTLVVGGPGSGKTENVLDQAIFSWIEQGLPLALFDSKYGKDGQAEKIVPYAIERGYEVRIFAPGSPESHTWNPHQQLKNPQDVAGAKQLVSTIDENSGDGAGGTKKDAFFDPVGKSVLGGAMLLAQWIAEREEDPLLANLLMTMTILNTDSLSERIIANREELDPWVVMSLSGLTNSRSEDGKNVTEAGILTNAVKTLSPMIIKEYLPALCGESTFPCFDESDPLKIAGKQLVVFGLNDENSVATAPIVATAIERIVSYNLRPGREDALGIFLDEFSSIKVEKVLEWLNKKRYVGASIALGIQHLGQLEANYGKEKAQGFLTGCATKFWFYPGAKATAEYLSGILGKEEIQQDNNTETYNSGKHGGKSRSKGKQTHTKDLIEVQSIMQLPQGTCIIESPGVSGRVNGRKADKIPFIHEFSFNAEGAKVLREKSEIKFGQIQRLMVQHNQERLETNFDSKLPEYREIVERLLPLKAKSEDSSEENLPVDLPVQVSGRALLAHFSKFHENISTIPIDPERQYDVPPDLIGDGKPYIEFSDIEKLLAYNKVEVAL